MTERARALRRGVLAERLAGEFLEAQGLRPITRNFRTPQGEIDLIMRDGDVLVFVEVRSRTSSAFVRAEETIDRRKQQRIVLAGLRFLQMNRESDCATCRFDVIIVTGSGANRKIEWLKRAFDA